MNGVKHSRGASIARWKFAVRPREGEPESFCAQPSLGIKCAWRARLGRSIKFRFRPPPGAGLRSGGASIAPFAAATAACCWRAGEALVCLVYQAFGDCVRQDGRTGRRDGSRFGLDEPHLGLSISRRPSAVPALIGLRQRFLCFCESKRVWAARVPFLPRSTSAPRIRCGL